jgi:hypothetical protein
VLRGEERESVWWRKIVPLTFKTRVEDSNCYVKFLLFFLSKIFLPKNNKGLSLGVSSSSTTNTIYSSLASTEQNRDDVRRPADQISVLIYRPRV